MEPRVKERHEEEHEDSKKERKKSKNNQLLYLESQDYQFGLNPLRSNRVEEMEVIIKNNVCKEM
jgi:hypothetical protein